MQFFLIFSLIFVFVKCSVNITCQQNYSQILVKEMFVKMKMSILIKICS